MTRTLASNMVTAAKAEVFEFYYLLSFAFSGGTVYPTTASNVGEKGSGYRSDAWFATL